MRADLTARLQNQPTALPSLLFGLNDVEVLTRPASGKWSIFENLAHLARYQEIVKERMELIIAGSNPLFPRYKADDDAGFFEWQKKSYAKLMGDFDKDRNSLNNYFALLAANQLQCTGRHPAFGTMTVEGWVEFFLLHEAHHVFTIFKLAAELKPERVMGSR